MHARALSSIATLLRLLDGALPVIRVDDALDDAFTQLGRTTDMAEAAGLQREITAMWAQSDNPDAVAAFQWANEAMGAGELDRALDCLQAALDLDPLFLEAWHLRATIRFLRDNRDDALSDLAYLLVLEPRHYEALSAVGHILRREGELDGARRAYRAALALNPHFRRARHGLDRLEVLRSAN